MIQTINYRIHFTFMIFPINCISNACQTQFHFFIIINIHNLKDKKTDTRKCRFSHRKIHFAFLYIAISWNIFLCIYNNCKGNMSFNICIFISNSIKVKVRVFPRPSWFWNFRAIFTYLGRWHIALNIHPL